MKGFFIAKNWIPLAVVITLMCGMLYWAVQQNYRMTANSPQIQMAEDAASQLASGATPDGIVGAQKTDLAKSLAPFIIIYDESGKVLASSAVLDGNSPTLPAGVLAAAKSNGENRVTWQPRPHIRHALIVKYVPGSSEKYVAAGRSLFEVEKLISQLTTGILIGWVITLFASLVAVVFFAWIAPKNPHVTTTE